MAKTRRSKAAQPPKTPEGLRIVALEVENVKRVKLVRIKPQRNLIAVSGKNGSGKSSLLDALDWTLTGITGMAAQPIRRGANSAHATVDLGEFIIHRTWTRVHEGKTDHITKLRIEGKNREVYPTPQKLLDSFMGAFTFDPVAFMRLDGAKQVESLRRVVTFAEDIDALEQEAKKVYEDRRVKGRELEAAKARLAGLPEPMEGLPDQPVDTAALTERLGHAANHNAAIDARERHMNSLIEQAQALAHQATEMRTEAARLLREAAEMDGLHVPVPVGTQAEGRIQQLRKEADAIVLEPREDIDSLTAELQRGQQVNAGIRQRDAWKAAKGEVETLTSEYAALEATYEQLRDRREKAIAEAKMPLEGLSVNMDESLVYWNGLPLDQASTAEQIRVSAAMAMALSPKLRVMHIKDGSLLDEESMAVLEEMAEEHDYQIWIERVSAEGEMGIVMEDGQASGEGVQEVKPF